MAISAGSTPTYSAGTPSERATWPSTASGCARSAAECGGADMMRVRRTSSGKQRRVAVMPATGHHSYVAHP